MSDAILAPPAVNANDSTIWTKLFTRSNTSTKAIVYSSSTDGELVLNYIALYFTVKIAAHISNGSYCLVCRDVTSGQPGRLKAGWGPCEFYSPLLTRRLQSDIDASSGNMSTFVPSYYIGGNNTYFSFNSSYDYVRVQTTSAIGNDYMATTTGGNLSITMYGLAIA